jgi:tRNA(His) 5'-end guanylyltransferase
MKENYENRWRFYLPRRIPVVIRVDGRAFHTVTKKAHRPFDSSFIKAMSSSAVRVAKEIQGCKAAYVQSDEVSFLLTDYDELVTDAWFDYNKSKIETTTASLMSVSFNHIWEWGTKLATFDARAFSIPREEVVNYFLWRAKDWERNSLQMLARDRFSHSELHGKNTADMHEMLHGLGLNWAKLNTQFKNGTWWLKRDSWCSETTILPSYEEIETCLGTYL